MAVNATAEGEVFFSDLPSYDAMAGFISTPIYLDGRPIAILIFQIPLHTVSNALTHDQNWLDKCFGESGETYLVSSLFSERINCSYSSRTNFFTRIAT